MDFILIIVLVIGVFLYVQNNWIYVNNINVKTNKLKLNNSYKIVHLSDLHNKLFGDRQRKLVNKIKKINTNIIFFTGDIVDSYSLNEGPAIILMKELIKIAPGQGFFPEYTQGIHKVKDTEMVVSRGLGNSAFPFRILNRPEIVSVDISGNS